MLVFVHAFHNSVYDTKQPPISCPGRGAVQNLPESCTLTTSTDTTLQIFSILSTQPSWILTPRATKLDAGVIRDTNDLIPEQPTFGAEQDLDGGLTALPEAAQDDLELMHVAVPVALVELVHDMGDELVGSIVGAALGLLEAKVAGAHADNGVAVGLGDGDVRVVLVRVDVEVEWLGDGTPFRIPA